MTIYTRTGDAGTTALFSGQRVSKADPRVETYGTLDELNATLSLCVCAVRREEHQSLLESLQHQLFWFSAELASDGHTPVEGQRYISPQHIQELEQAIDQAMAQVPPVKSFILPGRCEAASRLHFARTLARRAERRLVELADNAPVRDDLLRYLNRLSDALYALARVEDALAFRDSIVRKVAERYQAASAVDTRQDNAGTLDFHQLHLLMQATLRRATALGVPVVISVVDASGISMLNWRMPGAPLVSSTLAAQKAWTAVAMKTATHLLSAQVQPGQPLYGLDAHLAGKVVTFGGGYPIWRDNDIIAGLGISGGSVDEDMDIARTALLAIHSGIQP